MTDLPDSRNLLTVQPEQSMYSTVQHTVQYSTGRWSRDIFKKKGKRKRGIVVIILYSNVYSQRNFVATSFFLYFSTSHILSRLQ